MNLFQCDCNMRRWFEHLCLLMHSFIHTKGMQKTTPTWIQPVECTKQACVPPRHRPAASVHLELEAVRACLVALVVSDFATLWTVACQASLSMGFSRQEYWSGLPFPPPGDLPDPGIKPISPALAGVFFTTSTTWEAPNYCLPVGFLRNSAISWQKWVVHLHLEQSCSFFFSFFLETTIVVWYAAEVLSANCLFWYTEY